MTITAFNLRTTFLTPLFLTAFNIRKPKTTKATDKHHNKRQCNTQKNVSYTLPLSIVQKKAKVSAKSIIHMSTFKPTFHFHEFFNVTQNHMAELDVFRKFSHVCMYIVYPVKNNKSEIRLTKYSSVALDSTLVAFIVIQIARRRTDTHSKLSAERMRTLLRAEIEPCACLINTRI